MVQCTVSHTFWTAGVELFHGVVQADPDRGEAYLSVQPRHQTAVKAPRTLGLHHGDNGAKHTPVPHALDVQWGLGFALDLKYYTSTVEKRVQDIWKLYLILCNLQALKCVCRSIKEEGSGVRSLCRVEFLLFKLLSLLKIPYNTNIKQYRVNPLR